jgi:hypothetical protein
MPLRSLRRRRNPTHGFLSAPSAGAQTAFSAFDATGLAAATPGRTRIEQRDDGYPAGYGSLAVQPRHHQSLRYRAHQRGMCVGIEDNNLPRRLEKCRRSLAAPLTSIEAVIILRHTVYRCLPDRFDCPIRRRGLFQKRHQIAKHFRIYFIIQPRCTSKMRIASATRGGSSTAASPSATLVSS